MDRIPSETLSICYIYKSNVITLLPIWYDDIQNSVVVYLKQYNLYSWFVNVVVFVCLFLLFVFVLFGGFVFCCLCLVWLCMTRCN